MRPAALILQSHGLFQKPLDVPYGDDFSERRTQLPQRTDSLGRAAVQASFFYTARGLDEHDTLVCSAALTFYTLMSIVPIAALVFAVVKGFGLADGLMQNLYSLFPHNREVVDYLITFADKARSPPRREASSPSSGSSCSSGPSCGSSARSRRPSTISGR